MEVIDLTLSDSEDEDEVPQAQSSHEISSGCVSPPVINVDSPAGPLSISSTSSHDSPKRVSSRSNSSFSPHHSSSPSSSSSSSNSTIGYNYPGPSGARTPPGTPPVLHLSPRSPYKSPLHSPLSPVPSPHHISPLGTPNSYLPHFPGMPIPVPLPLAMTMPSNMYVNPPQSVAPLNDDPDIEEFLQPLSEYR